VREAEHAVKSAKDRQRLTCVHAPGVPEVNEGSTLKPETRISALRESAEARGSSQADPQGPRIHSKLTSRRSRPGGSGL
jgi:hypothetical protein